MERNLSELGYSNEKTFSETKATGCKFHIDLDTQLKDTSRIEDIEDEGKSSSCDDDEVDNNTEVHYQQYMVALEGKNFTIDYLLGSILVVFVALISDEPELAT